MFLSDIREVKYSARDIRLRIALSTLVIIVFGFGLFDRTLNSLFLTLLCGPPIAYYLFRNLYVLIFSPNKTIIAIGPNGFKDLRLVQELIPWPAVARIEEAAPTLAQRILRTIFLVLGNLLSATPGTGADGTEDTIAVWCRPDGIRDRKPVFSLFHTARSANELRQLRIETSGLTMSKERLMQLLQTYHAHHNKALNDTGV
ncbi:hypothetical protein [Rhizobium leguminosarum]|uniref:Uncharacterized protein n=2 Tax=Rhizobium TaxID=379 RepID=A0A179B923_RHILE|nr:hypothetical protein [Rhizobium leguminosarum]MBY5439556.1 hypothetical protein [Rhizobium leguminosarum]NEI34944.1 hypothetical protein [Rhizobium leguminosarum]NEI41459.1 hypothetical protein [Rhizobium leguminosarum]OAP88207.1 hypothetical protein A4U53_08890 [Rhizobium leguminosarum]